MRTRDLVAAMLVAVTLSGCGEQKPQKTRVQVKSAGAFLSKAGEEGEAKFGQEYLDTPTVELNVPNAAGALGSVKHTTVVEVKADKFKWRNTAKQGDPNG